MRLVLQRVSSASVRIGGEVAGAIGPGLLALVGLREGDDEAIARKALDKAIGLRVFPDDGGNMNRSLDDIGGGLLLVSQFTLYADIRKGRRPSFTDAMHPSRAEPLYERVVAMARDMHRGPVETGRFGAMMEVSLVNDGPVTITLDTESLWGLP